MVSYIASDKHFEQDNHGKTIIKIQSRFCKDQIANPIVTEE